MAFTLDTEARGLLPFYAILVQLDTFTVLRQNALTFTLPPPYAIYTDVSTIRAGPLSRKRALGAVATRNPCTLGGQLTRTLRSCDFGLCDPRRRASGVVSVSSPHVDCRVRAAMLNIGAHRRSSFDPNLHTSCPTAIQTLPDSYTAIKIDGVKDASSTQPKLKGSAIKDWQG